MTTVSGVFDLLNAFAPTDTAMQGDNVGLLLGDGARPVTHILVALDATEAVSDEAEALGAGLIVTHHPVFWGVRSITTATAEGRKLCRMIERRQSVISMHTNLDAAAGGVNDALAARLGLRCLRSFQDSHGLMLGRVGQLPEATDARGLALHVKSALRAGGVRYIDGGSDISLVAVIGGSGGADFELARGAGADALVTGDGKYSVYLPAWEERFTVIDAGHFATENVICEPLAQRLREALPGVAVTVSARHADVLSYV